MAVNAIATSAIATIGPIATIYNSTKIAVYGPIILAFAT
jgi:hypothetical protein